jgi:fructokinase
MAVAPVEIVGLGEILWDLLPGGRQLGGAPLNFVFHCHQLGHVSAMVSRVGKDEPGTAIRTELRNLGLCDTFVQSDSQHPTGSVAVEIAADGQPTYQITPEVAWDYLAWDDQLDLMIRQATAVCFGTLAQRHAVTRETIHRALALVPTEFIVFDVNLRQSFYTREIIESSLAVSRWVKLNDEELGTLRALLDLPAGTDSQTLAALRSRYRLELACLTRGQLGCLVQTDEEEISVPGRSVQVVDTVGAGDAFTAGLLVYALEGHDLADAAVFANRLAAKVAGSAGGTPRVDRSELEGKR